MSTDTLAPRLRALIATLSPQERTQLAQRIAVQLRDANIERITQQIQPDGTPFEPRKPQPIRYKAAQAKLRRRLFEKLGTRKYLRIHQANANQVEIGFKPNAARIAAVHHYGEIDRVEGRLRVRYAARQLLGINQSDRVEIANILIGSLKVSA